MTHCFRYESIVKVVSITQPGQLDSRARERTPSIVGSYSGTKWLWINWMVKHDFPTPPPPTTTNLYSRRNWHDKTMTVSAQRCFVSQKSFYQQANDVVA